MCSQLTEALGLTAAVESLPPDALSRLVATSDLSADERRLLGAAVVALPLPVADVAHRLLEAWDELGPVERTAGLLALAEALASP